MLLQLVCLLAALFATNSLHLIRRMVIIMIVFYRAGTLVAERRFRVAEETGYWCLYILCTPPLIYFAVEFIIYNPLYIMWVILLNVDTSSIVQDAELICTITMDLCKILQSILGVIYKGIRSVMRIIFQYTYIQNQWDIMYENLNDVRNAYYECIHTIERVRTFAWPLIAWYLDLRRQHVPRYPEHHHQQDFNHLHNDLQRQQLNHLHNEQQRQHYDHLHNEQHRQHYDHLHNEQHRQHFNILHHEQHRQYLNHLQGQLQRQPRYRVSLINRLRPVRRLTFTSP